MMQQLTEQLEVSGTMQVTMTTLPLTRKERLKSGQNRMEHTCTWQLGSQQTPVIHGWRFFSAELLACKQTRMGLSLDTTVTPQTAIATSLSMGSEISVDASQDGKGAVTIDSSNLVTVELKKPLSSGDSAGKDIAWTEDSTYALIIMWNSKLLGSSGGSITHGGTQPTERTVLINSNGIPEFPGLIFATILVATAISAIFLRRRMVKKPTVNVIS